MDRFGRRRRCAVRLAAWVVDGVSLEGDRLSPSQGVAAGVSCLLVVPEQSDDWRFRRATASCRPGGVARDTRRRVADTDGCRGGLREPLHHSVRVVGVEAASSSAWPRPSRKRWRGRFNSGYGRLCARSRRLPVQRRAVRNCHPPRDRGHAYAPDFEDRGGGGRGGGCSDLGKIRWTSRDYDPEPSLFRMTLYPEPRSRSMSCLSTTPVAKCSRRRASDRQPVDSSNCSLNSRAQTSIR